MRIPTYTYREIDELANAFLEKYHPESTVPVPIEEIVEVDLRIEIFPLSGIEEEWQMAGYLSNDLLTITVDERTMKRVPWRYRFTLAHEVGHISLHGEYIRENFPESEIQWRRWLQKIQPDAYTRMEREAHRFANAVLVPCNALAPAWEDARAKAIRNGFDPDNFDEVLIDRMASSVAKDFVVHGTTLHIALKRCGILSNKPDVY